MVIKKDGVVIEAVQVKNVSADLTLSSLASTKTSKGGDGFFNRMCSLHNQNPSFRCIKVVYFNELGTELQEIQSGNKKIWICKVPDERKAREVEQKYRITSKQYVEGDCS